MAAKAERSRRTTLGWRIVAAAGALVYAVVAWNSAFDRQSGRDASAAPLVADPFRAKADVVAARQLLRRGNLDAAQATAMRAVAADPIDRNSTAMLGAARGAAGDAAGAQAAFLVAAKTGWRQPVTQRYWLEASLAIGDWDLAALRLDALLRAARDFDDASDALTRFEDDARGRLALARRLALDPPWRKDYLAPPADASDETLARRAAVLITQAEANDQMGCDPVAPLTARLVQRGYFAPAVTIWEGHCNEADIGAAIRDGDFARFMADDGPSPLGWQSQPSANVRLRVRGNGDDAALEVTNNGRIARLALSQPVQFRGPTARIAWEAGDAADRIDVSLDCGGARRPGFAGGEMRSLAVPDCPFQILRVWIAPGNAPVTLQSVRVVD